MTMNEMQSVSDQSFVRPPGMLLEACTTESRGRGHELIAFGRINVLDQSVSFRLINGRREVIDGFPDDVLGDKNPLGYRFCPGGSAAVQRVARLGQRHKKAGVGENHGRFAVP